MNSPSSTRSWGSNKEKNNMAITEIQKQTNANIQEKANLIWEIATHLVGLYKPHEYGKVILPMTVLKRFDDALAPTKAKVLEANDKLKEQGFEGEVRDGALQRTSGYAFYNTSKFDFARLLADPDNIAENFDDYMKGYIASYTIMALHPGRQRSCATPIIAKG